MMNERQRVIAEALLRRRLRNFVRIDDDIYADTSFITHVEYQMFLDDKQLEGKFYHPDHWLHPQFPKGKGRQPAVGIRPEDSLLFCLWLTEHIDNLFLENWKYRLPNKGEISSLKITDHLNTKIPAGYWVLDGKTLSFEQIVNTPPKLSQNRVHQYCENDLRFARDRDIDASLNLNLGLQNTLAQFLDQVFVLIENRPLDLTYVATFAKSQDVTADPYPSPEFESLLTTITERLYSSKNIGKLVAEINIDQILDLADALDRDLLNSIGTTKSQVEANELADFVHSLSNVIYTAPDSKESSNNDSEDGFYSKWREKWEREQETYNLIDRKYRIETAFNNASNIVVARERALSHLQKLAKQSQPKFIRTLLRLILILLASLCAEKYRKKTLFKLLELYIDFIILEERINGNLPAFEGIYVVRERLKNE